MALPTMARQLIKEESTLLLSSATHCAESSLASSISNVGGAAARGVIKESPVAMKGVMGNVSKMEMEGLGSGALRDMATGESSVLQQHLTIVRETLPVPSPTSASTLAPLRQPSPSQLLHSLHPTSLPLSSTTRTSASSATRSILGESSSSVTGISLTEESMTEIKEALNNGLQEGVEEQLDQVVGMVKVGLVEIPLPGGLGGFGVGEVLAV